MNNKTWIPLVLAVVLGLMAAVIGRNMLLRNRVAGIPQGDSIDVVVAKATIAPGRTLTPADLTTARLSGKQLPPGMFTNATELDKRVVVMQLVAGQPVLDSLLAPSGAGSGLQALVASGMRAITVEVNEYSGVAGLLIPGCRVDVISTLTGDGKEKEMVAKTIVQNARVLAVGQRMSGEKTEGEAPMIKTVTVLVQQKGAEAIELACALGRPRLVLRANGDNGLVGGEGMTLAELRGTSKNSKINEPVQIQPVEIIRPSTQPVQPVQVPETITHRQVQIFRGGVESQVTFESRKTSTGEVTNIGVDPFMKDGH